jgi:hypothetical protein
MQNEANFRKSQMNVNLYNTMDYEEKSDWTPGENEPKTNPIKANLHFTAENTRHGARLGKGPSRSQGACLSRHGRAMTGRSRTENLATKTQRREDKKKTYIINLGALAPLWLCSFVP